MNIYIGSDGNIRDNSLMHYKYIKKIGNRYFYTQDALRAYYEAQKGIANAEYVKDTGINKVKRTKNDIALEKHYADRRRRETQFAGGSYKRDIERNINRERNIEKGIIKVNRGAQDAYLKTRREVKPVAKTAKRAVTPVASAKKAEEYVNRLVNGKNVTLSDIRKKKKEIERKTAKKISKNQAQHRRVSSKENRQIYKGRNQYKPAARW